MTQDVWNRMTEAEKRVHRDLSQLSPQLVGLEGKRVRAVAADGEVRRFIVGRSTGWVPVHLEIRTRRSMCGDPADRHYQSVMEIER